MRMRWSCFIVFAGLFAALVFSPVLPAQEGETDTIILDTAGFWRVHYTMKPPMVKRGEEVQEIKTIAVWLNRGTPLPPEGWAKPDFADSSWARFPGVVSLTWKRDPKSPFIALVCMRGKFKVIDPAKAKDLTLSASYRGGIVVYINGKEVARGNIPEGKIDMDTLAEGYPSDTFTDADREALGSWRTKAAERAKLFSKVERKITGVKVPAKLLHKGVNVLAVEVHRMAYNEKDVKIGKKWNERLIIDWGSCGLMSIRLTAAGGDGIVPNIARPKKLQVWNSNPMKVDCDMDYGDENEKLEPIYLVGTQNGAFSGKVVVGSAAPIKGLKAEITDLKGKGNIPASAVQIRYTKADWFQKGSDRRYLAVPTCFAGLEEAPPAEVQVTSQKRLRSGIKLITSPGVSPSFGAVVPVWVTVNVPADAKPGDYEGKLTISATGAEPVEVLVSLKVCGWKLPDPPDYVTWADIVQSPESVALKYKVPLWSDDHFKYLEKSFKLLGQIGNKVAYIQLICHTNMGNAETMVRWIEQGDGTYKYDFSAMDKYLDLVEKYQGKPAVVCFYVWDTYLEGGTGGAAVHAKSTTNAERNAHEGKGALVTVLDGDGKTETMALRMYSTPEQTKPLWKPLMEEIRSRLKKRGLEKAMMLGIATDNQPTKEVISFFKEILPGVPWVSHGHAMPKDLHGVPVEYLSGVWAGGKFPRDPSVGRTYGWGRIFTVWNERKPKFSSSPFGPVLVHHPRSMRGNFPVTAFRMTGEMNIAGSQRGFARMGADFWGVLGGSRGRRRSLSARYAKTIWRNLDIHFSVFSAGKNGAISTQRFEMLREGMQECEARIFIEKAILEKKISGELAKKCQAILDERISPMRMGVASFTCSGVWTSYVYIDNSWYQCPGIMGYYWYIGSGWQARSQKLFMCAGEVAKKLGQ